MTANNREQAALNAYLHLLEGKGATGDHLTQRRALAMCLIPLLEQQPLDGSLYREHVEQVLQQMDKALWPAFLAAAREYYYFWTGDIKTIAAMHSSGGYDIAPPACDVPAENLRTLWESLDRETFEVAEIWPLKAYASALREEGSDKTVIDTRCKLVKLLLVRLRDAGEKDAAHYRVAVDSTVPLFAMKETRQLFLVVVREFFYFWIGDPDAPSRIVLDMQQAEI